MNVGLVMPTSVDDGPAMAGGERYALELARALAPLVRTTLITFAPQAKATQVGPLTIECHRILSDRAGALNPIAFSHLGTLSRCDRAIPSIVNSRA